jgi:hypothetical protein
VRAGLAVASAVTVLGGAVGCGASPRPPRPLGQWISYDAGRRTVTISLVPGYNGVLNGFNLNGYGKGQVDVIVPLGWTVTVRCESAGGGHPCGVVSGPGSTGPALAGSSSASGRFSFRASRAGVYRLASLLPGEEGAGMWDVLEVRRVSAPSVLLLRRSP